MALVSDRCFFELSRRSLAPRVGLVGRRGRSTWRADGEARHQPLLGDGAVAELAALLVDDDPHTGPSRAMTRSRWTGRSEGDPSTSKRSSTRGGGLVGVLATRPPDAAEPHRELGERDAHAACHDEVIVGHRVRLAYPDQAAKRVRQNENAFSFCPRVPERPTQGPAAPHGDDPWPKAPGSTDGRRS